MEKFIRPADYFSQIRPELLDTILTGDETFLSVAESASIDEMISYLSGQYDTDKIFAVVYDWSKTDTYSTDDRVQLVSSIVWNVTDTFTDGAYITDANELKVYRVKNTPVAGTLITNTGFFDEIAKQGSLFYAKQDVTAGVEIDDDSFWSAGDTRSALVLRYLVDIVLYEIHCRINPRNIPEHRIQRRDDAIKWLKYVGDPRSNVSANLPLITQADGSGYDVTWGSNQKTTHYY